MGPDRPWAEEQGTGCFGADLWEQKYDVASWISETHLKPDLLFYFLIDSVRIKACVKTH